MNLCKLVRLYFENGDVREVPISRKVSDEEVEHMGLGNYFNVSGLHEEENRQRCIRLEIE